MNDKFNTIAGWVLGGGIVLLGATLVTGELFKGERPETMGYPIAGVVEEGGAAEAEQPIAALLQTADAARGANSFKKCTACHTINQGGANGVGPNLFGSLGAPLGHAAGFAYSDALKGVGGTWNFDNMSEWLRSPRAFAPGTKMTFAGLGDPQERADLILYLNQQGSNLPLPAAPAAPAEGAAAEGNASANASGNAAAPPGPEATANSAASSLKGGGEGHPAGVDPGAH